MFLRAQAEAILATDFFTVDTCCYVVTTCSSWSRVHSRVVHLFGVTTDPDGSWVAQVARTFVADLDEQGRPSRSLLRGRDTKFTAPFDATRSGWVPRWCSRRSGAGANAFAEPWVRTVHQDCLDHLLVASRRQLESVLCDYVRYYNQARPHRGLHLTVPGPCSGLGPWWGRTSSDVVGGITHEYERAA